MCAYANVREFGAPDGRPDARPAIQEAIDYVVNEGGGEVFFPKGTYIIGTPNPEPRTATNHPLIIRNEKKEAKLRLIGEGIGETYLRLCDEANVLWPGYDARSADTNPQCAYWIAGPIFVNGGNAWWFDPHNPNPALPWDYNIEIANMTFDGNKNHQTRVYEPQFRTPVPTMHDVYDMYGGGPTMQWEGSSTPGGMLDQGRYDIFIRFMDGAGNEGRSCNFVNTLAAGQNTITVTLPPPQFYPEGPAPQEARYIVPYIRRADYLGLHNWNVDSPANEVDPCGNGRYERLKEFIIPLADLRWDGYLGVSHWPKVDITSRARWEDRRQGALGTQGNYRVPGKVQWYGDTVDSNFCDFGSVENLYVHHVEVCNFALDGVLLRDVRNSRFSGGVDEWGFNRPLHVHHNGRHGIAIVSNILQGLEFNYCKIELNESGGIDCEPAGGQGLTLNHCEFLNQGYGFSIGAVGTNDYQDLQFNDCTFDGSYGYHIANVGFDVNIRDLKINRCVFRNNYSNCVLFISDGNQKITGEISGCTFDLATGRRLGESPPHEAAEFPPVYFMLSTEVSMIRLNGLGTTFSITDNYFKPWFWSWTSPDEPHHVYRCNTPVAAIDITGTSTLHTIAKNTFALNENDTRDEPPINLANPELGDTSWGSGLKNRNFIFSETRSLNSCRSIAGNRFIGPGDGYIWVDGRARYSMTQVLP